MQIFKKIFDRRKSRRHNILKINIDNFCFLSSDHIRYENGIDKYGHQKGAYRLIKFVKHQMVKDVFTVTMYKLNGFYSISKMNNQMQPKTMKIISQNDSRIVLRGFANDLVGFPFSCYGITINLKNAQAESIVMHMYDEKVDIEYFK